MPQTPELHFHLTCCLINATFKAQKAYKNGKT